MKSRDPEYLPRNSGFSFVKVRGSKIALRVNDSSKYLALGSNKVGSSVSR